MTFLTFTTRLTVMAALTLAAVGSHSAEAQDFSVFGGQPFGSRPSGGQPFGGPSFFGQPFGVEPAPRPRVYIRTRPEPSRQNAYCVRTCDGRYFPYPAGRGETDVKACNAVCPSSEMRLYSGSEIKTSTSEQGKPYDKLANAFRFQREVVANCTCNAQTGFGLTPISARDDLTLRTGDIIAESDGLKIATVSEGSHRRRGSIMFRPLSSDRARALGLPRAALK